MAKYNFMTKLSYILRHQPHLVDSTGWADVSFICRELQITEEKLEHIVLTNNKKRFEFSQDGKKIRALQGHSFDVDLQLNPSEPPEILYHGTSIEADFLISQEGIKKQKRHAVHLTENFQTALLTGLRHGEPIALEVEALRMYNDGHKFFLTENNVWLTDYVPPQYLKSEV